MHFLFVDWHTLSIYLFNNFLRGSRQLLSIFISLSILSIIHLSACSQFQDDTLQFVKKLQSFVPSCSVHFLSDESRKRIRKLLQISFPFPQSKDLLSIPLITERVERSSPQAIIPEEDIIPTWTEIGGRFQSRERNGGTKSATRVFSSTNNKKPSRYPRSSFNEGTAGWSVPRYPWHGYKGICVSLLNAPSLNEVSIISAVIVRREAAILVAFEPQGQ